MFYIGCHLSASDGFLAMGRTALSIGANTFQFFTRNPRGSKAKAIDPADVAAFLALAAENGFGTLVAHAPYTINPCSKDEHTREFARMTLADDLKRMEHLPGNVYNFHPGSHTGQGMETGIGQIAETLNAILTPGLRTTVLLETMSGKGSEVGSRFEELREIIDRVALSDKLGVCLDTRGAPTRIAMPASARAAWVRRRWAGWCGIPHCRGCPSCWRRPTSCRATPGRSPC